MATDSKHYDFNKIEQYWQSVWDKDKPFKAVDFDNRPKFYALAMLPYPSGEGLHIGHPESYTAIDILSRYKTSCGYNVLYPMGWDAFGLPAEQHAIATGTHPKIKTKQNEATFKRQMKTLGLAIDWDREIDTTDPEFFKWTQWLFLQLFKKGLAYVDERPVWWCDALGTVLSNEEVVEGRSEVGNHPVERKNLRQWVLKITAHADRLLKGLEDLDWPSSTKRQQKTWIGRSEGSDIHFDVEGLPGERLTAYTTACDTLYGSSFLVVAPEHPLVQKLTKNENRAAIEKYTAEAARKSELARSELSKHKSGVFTGSYAINPISGEKMQIWIADYVLMTYGTGVVMGVPAHDERDYEFALKFKLPIRCVLKEKKEDTEETIPLFIKNGYLTNSGEFNGLSSKEAKKAITQKLAQKGHAQATVNYKLRDWLFCRQRYWGEPFPVFWVDKASYDKVLESKSSPLKEFLPEEPVTYRNGEKLLYCIPMAASELPLELPEVESYKPLGGGASPLEAAKDWLEVYVDIQTGKSVSAKEQQPKGDNWVFGTRETNTMPQWAGSCWYYLRYLDPNNDKEFLNKDIESYWKTPDIYIGGSEHAVTHLLYARFWHQVFFDLGLLSTPEPFPKLFHQGLILGEPEHQAFKNDNGEYISFEFVTKDYRDSRTNEPLTIVRLKEDMLVKSGDGFVLTEDSSIKVESRCFKMSKSRGNVISPDDIIKDYGADALRIYEMFLGPLEANKPWSTQNLEGTVRFLRRVWREFIGEEGQVNEKIAESYDDPDTETVLQQTIKKVSDDIENLAFNTAVSQLMICINQFQKAEKISKDAAKRYIQLLAPFAPHIGEELYARLGFKGCITHIEWPKYNPAQAKKSNPKVVVQVNGKLRAELDMDGAMSKDQVIALAKAQEKVIAFIEGKEIVKEIYVPGKIVNLVVK